MESGIASIWGWSLFGFAFGIACGFGVAYVSLCNNRRSKQLQEQYDALQQEFEGYRSQVGQHFLRTSELVHKMTESYREVYEHLAAGSQALCQNPLSPPQLELPERPMLDTAGRDKAPETFSGAATDASGLDSDDYIGDSPRVPTLDMDMTPEQARATPRTPSR